MRQIGLIPDRKYAERFADHLRSSGTACTVDEGPDGYRVWVHDDDRVATAKAELTTFIADPNDARFRDAARRAMERLHEETLRRNAARGRIVNLSANWDARSRHGNTVTSILIGLMILVAFFTGIDPKENDPVVNRLLISNDGTFNPILRGEIWRLITPIFLHSGPAHLIFNLMALFQLGTQIELRLGSFRFVGLVLLIAIVSNLAQFVLNSPDFGGMSGVAYGLFGYSWIRGKLAPDSGLGISPNGVMCMLVWFVLCLTGIVGSIANWAHGVGLVLGIAVAISETYLRSGLRRK